MTSEIAIANGGAVALAVDSAATVGAGKKIYTSDDKLFKLSDVHPVGIITFGNAHLMDVPWDLLINSCRKELGDTKFDTLEEYASYFIQHVKSHIGYFSEEHQLQWMCSRVEDFYQGMMEEVDTSTTPSHCERSEAISNNPRLYATVL